MKTTELCQLLEASPMYGDAFVICSRCGCIMCDGYVIDGCYYACSKECRRHFISDEDYMYEWSNDDEFDEDYIPEEDRDYWTEWNSQCGEPLAALLGALSDADINLTVEAELPSHIVELAKAWLATEDK